MAMNKKTRNEYIALAVILLILGYLLYHYVFAGSSNKNPAVNPALLQNAALGGAAPASTTSSSSGPAVVTQFLPNGASINVSLLKGPVFNSLQPLPQFTVGSADLGLTNPFSPAASTGTATPPATK